MTTFAERMVALERRLLDRFGANGILSGSGTVYDPDTDSMVPAGAGPRTVRMTLGEVELHDDQGCTIYPTAARLQVEPTRGDTILFAGTTYTVGNVHRLYEADVVTLYIAEVS